MRTLTWIISLLIIYCFTACGHTDVAKDNASQEDSLTLKRKEVAESLHELRELALHITPQQLQLSLPSDSTIVFGVVMDLGIDEHVATLVSYQTGDASLYLSSGSAILGGGQHESVSIPVKEFVKTAQSFISKATKTIDTSMPVENEVKFYLLTSKGIYVGSEWLSNFDNGASIWLSLFEKGNVVLSAIQQLGDTLPDQ